MQKKETFLILSVALNIGIGIILFTPAVNVFLPPIIVDEQVETASVIVVLSRGASPSGQLCFGSLLRMKKAAILYWDGVSNRIICSGGVYYPAIDKTIAQLMKEEFVFQKIPEADILVQDETLNTFNDISYVIKKYQTQFDLNKAVFVTSSYHTQRVKLILKKKGLEARVVSASDYQFNPVVWSERIAIFRDLVREYMVLFYFKVRGYI